GRLTAVAAPESESALVVLQLADVDDGLALAADGDQRHLRTDCDDRAFDRLALFDAPGSLRRLEHRLEIFLGFAHEMLLLIVYQVQPLIAKRGRAVLLVI